MSFTRHDYLDLGTFTMSLWTKKYAEILSIFDLPRLQEAMGAYVELESPGEDEDLLAASQDERNPDRAVMDAFQRLYTRIFITLWDRGVLASFIVLDDEDKIPERAQRQLWDAMVEEVESYNTRKTARQQAPVAPVVVAENPIDVCVREFHDLGSNAFKTKWLNNSKNRVYYEQAIEAGRI